MEIYDSIATLIWCFSSVTCASSSVLAFSAACLSKDAVSLRLCRIIPVREVGLITFQLTLAVRYSTYRQSAEWMSAPESSLLLWHPSHFSES